MSDDDDKSPPSITQDWLAQLFVAAQPRSDRDQILLATPTDPAPFLVQGGEHMVALTLAVELLDRVVAAGGSHLPRNSVMALRDSLRGRFEERHRAHLEEELLRSLSWLKDTFSRAPEDTDSEAELDVGVRIQMIEEAQASGRDLFIGFIEPETAHVQRFRVRPIRIESDPVDDERAVLRGHRVPGGDELQLPLDQIRWILQAQRFHALEKPKLASVLAFPPAKSEE